MTVIRSTIQTVEAAVLYPTKVRVTQQYVQIAYVEGAGPTIHNESASNELSLGQSVSVIGVFSRSASNTLELTQSVEGNTDRKAGTSLFLTQSVSVLLVLNISVESTLSLTSSATVVRARSYAASNALSLTQAATVIRVIPTQVVSNSLSLTQSVDVGHVVSNTLVLTQSVTAWIDHHYATSVLTLTQSASAFIADQKAASNTLIMTQSVSVIKYTGIPVSNTLALTHFAIATIKKNYVTLTAPFPGAGAGIILPAPLLGDKENTVSQSAVKRAMDGTTYTYVNRSPNRLLSYTFNLSRAKGLELKAFLEDHNGDTMWMQDWKGATWSVNLMTNPVSFVQNRRSAPNGPNVGVNLQFEGVKISG